MHTRKAIRYICDHCNKGFWNKAKAIKHERDCYYDPSNKCCGTCKHLYYDGINKERAVCEFFDKNLEPLCLTDEFKMEYQFDCKHWKLKSK